MQTMLPEANPKKAIRLNITTLDFYQLENCLQNDPVGIIYKCKIGHRQCDQIGRFFALWATIFGSNQFPKSPTFLGNFCKGVKIIHFSIEIIVGQLLQTFGNFYLVVLQPNTFLRLGNTFLANIYVWPSFCESTSHPRNQKL